MRRAAHGDESDRTASAVTRRQQPLGATLDPYVHALRSGELEWLCKHLTLSINDAAPGIQAAWQAAVAPPPGATSQEAAQDVAQRTLDTLFPSVTMMSNWVINLRVNFALLEGLRRGDLRVEIRPDASLPRFQLTAQGAARALDLEDYIQQTAVAPQRNGLPTAFAVLGAPTTA